MDINEDTDLNGRFWRKIELNSRDLHAYPNNRIKTSRYTWYGFVPQNLLEQFGRAANLWFLFVSILQLLPFRLSPTSSWATVVPLTFVLLLTMIKDGYEDYHRYLADVAVNKRRVLVVKQRIQYFREQEMAIRQHRLNNNTSASSSGQSFGLTNNLMHKWNKDARTHNYQNNGTAVNNRSNQIPNVSQSASNECLPSEVLSSSLINNSKNHDFNFHSANKTEKSAKLFYNNIDDSDVRTSASDKHLVKADRHVPPITFERKDSCANESTSNNVLNHSKNVLNTSKSDADDKASYPYTSIKINPPPHLSSQNPPSSPRLQPSPSYMPSPLPLVLSSTPKVAPIPPLVVQITCWEDLKVGQIVCLQDGDLVPADLVLLATDVTSGSICSLETSALDGESDLKLKVSPDETAVLHSPLALIKTLRGRILVPPPSAQMDHFKGTLRLDALPRGVPLDTKNLMLRGSQVRNVHMAMGVVIYTGPDTKLSLNSSPATKIDQSTQEDKASSLCFNPFDDSKRHCLSCQGEEVDMVGKFGPDISRRSMLGGGARGDTSAHSRQSVAGGAYHVHKYLIFLCTLIVVMSLIGSLIGYSNARQMEDPLKSDWAVTEVDSDEIASVLIGNTGVIGFLQLFCSYLILLNNLIPISLYVMLDVVHWWLGWKMKRFGTLKSFPYSTQSVLPLHKLKQSITPINIQNNAKSSTISPPTLITASKQDQKETQSTSQDNNSSSFIIKPPENQTKLHATCPPTPVVFTMDTTSLVPASENLPPSLSGTTKKENHVIVRDPSVTEAFGRVDTIFLDKTGTLTQNILEFSLCSVGCKVYGFEKYPMKANVPFKHNYPKADKEKLGVLHGKSIMENVKNKARMNGSLAHSKHGAFSSYGSEVNEILTDFKIKNKMNFVEDSTKSLNIMEFNHYASLKNDTEQKNARDSNQKQNPFFSDSSINSHFLNNKVYTSKRKNTDKLSHCCTGDEDNFSVSFPTDSKLSIKTSNNKNSSSNNSYKQYKRNSKNNNNYQNEGSSSRLLRSPLSFPLSPPPIQPSPSTAIRRLQTTLFGASKPLIPDTEADAKDTLFANTVNSTPAILKQSFLDPSFSTPLQTANNRENLNTNIGDNEIRLTTVALSPLPTLRSSSSEDILMKLLHKSGDESEEGSMSVSSVRSSFVPGIQKKEDSNSINPDTNPDLMDSHDHSSNNPTTTVSMKLSNDTNMRQESNKILGVSTTYSIEEIIPSPEKLPELKMKKKLGFKLATPYAFLSSSSPLPPLPSLSGPLWIPLVSPDKDTISILADVFNQSCFDPASKIFSSSTTYQQASNILNDKKYTTFSNANTDSTQSSTKRALFACARGFASSILKGIDALNIKTQTNLSYRRKKKEKNKESKKNAQPQQNQTNSKDENGSVPKTSSVRSLSINQPYMTLDTLNNRITRARYIHEFLIGMTLCNEVLPLPSTANVSEDDQNSDELRPNNSSTSECVKIDSNNEKNDKKPGSQSPSHKASKNPIFNDKRTNDSIRIEDINNNDKADFYFQKMNSTVADASLQSSFDGHINTIYTENKKNNSNKNYILRTPQTQFPLSTNPSSPNATPPLSPPSVRQATETLKHTILSAAALQKGENEMRLLEEQIDLMSMKDLLPLKNPSTSNIFKTSRLESNTNKCIAFVNKSNNYIGINDNSNSTKTSKNPSYPVQFSPSLLSHKDMNNRDLLNNMHDPTQQQHHYITIPSNVVTCDDNSPMLSKVSSSSPSCVSAVTSPSNMIPQLGVNEAPLTLVPLNHEEQSCIDLMHNLTRNALKSPITLVSASQDETALVRAAAACGYVLAVRQVEGLIGISIFGQPFCVQLVDVCGFSSERSRMTCVLTIPGIPGAIVLTKGSEDAVLRLCSDAPFEMRLHANLLAKRGLRTLMIARRWISEEKLQLFIGKIKDARSSLVFKARLLDEAAAVVETGMTLLGVTGVLDRIAPGVPFALSQLREGGLKLNIVTGDRKDTTLMVAKKCGILVNNSVNFGFPKLNPLGYTPSNINYFSKQNANAQSHHDNYKGSNRMRDNSELELNTSKSFFNDDFAQKRSNDFQNKRDNTTSSSLDASSRDSWTAGVGTDGLVFDIDTLFLSKLPGILQDRLRRFLKHGHKGRSLNNELRRYLTTNNDTNSFYKNSGESVYSHHHHHHSRHHHQNHKLQSTTEDGNKFNNVSSENPSADITHGNQSQNPSLFYSPKIPNAEANTQSKSGSNESNCFSQIEIPADKPIQKHFGHHRERAFFDSSLQIPVDLIAAAEFLSHEADEEDFIIALTRVYETLRTTIVLHMDRLRLEKLAIVTQQQQQQKIRNKNYRSSAVIDDANINYYSGTTRMMHPGGTPLHSNALLDPSPLLSVSTPTSRHFHQNTFTLSSTPSPNLNASDYMRSERSSNFHKNPFMLNRSDSVTPYMWTNKKNMKVDGKESLEDSKWSSQKKNKFNVEGAIPNKKTFSREYEPPQRLSRQKSETSSNGSFFPPAMSCSQVSSSPSVLSVSLISGSLIHLFFQSPRRRFLFSAIMQLCTVNISCRVSSFQKALLVRLNNESLDPPSVSLAIGDGANDVAMIRTATIGVGIVALEGHFAALHADVVVRKLSLLPLLIFVHGVTAAHRSLLVIHFSIYKNILLVFPLFLFGILTNMSATALIDGFLLLSYNSLWTSVSLLIAATTSVTLPPQVLLNCPRLFVLGRPLTHHPLRILLPLLLEGCIISIFVFFMSYGMCAVDNPHNDILTFGCEVFLIVIILANIRLFSLVRCIASTFMISLILSCVLPLPTLFLFSLFISDSNQHFKRFKTLPYIIFNHSRFWLCLFACVSLFMSYCMVLRLVLQNVDEIRRALRKIKDFSPFLSDWSTIPSKRLIAICADISRKIPHPSYFTARRVKPPLITPNQNRTRVKSRQKQHSSRLPFPVISASTKNAKRKMNTKKKHPLSPFLYDSQSYSFDSSQLSHDHNRISSTQNPLAHSEFLKNTRGVIRHSRRQITSSQIPGNPAGLLPLPAAIGRIRTSKPLKNPDFPITAENIAVEPIENDIGTALSTTPFQSRSLIAGIGYAGDDNDKEDTKKKMDVMQAIVEEPTSLGSSSDNMSTNDDHVISSLSSFLSYIPCPCGCEDENAVQYSIDNIIDSDSMRIHKSSRNRRHQHNSLLNTRFHYIPNLSDEHSKKLKSSSSSENINGIHNNCNIFDEQGSMRRKAIHSLKSRMSKGLFGLEFRFKSPFDQHEYSKFVEATLVPTRIILSRITFILIGSAHLLFMIAVRRGLQNEPEPINNRKHGLALFVHYMFGPLMFSLVLISLLRPSKIFLKQQYEKIMFGVYIFVIIYNGIIQIMIRSYDAPFRPILLLSACFMISRLEIRHSLCISVLCFSLDIFGLVLWQNWAMMLRILPPCFFIVFFSLITSVWMERNDLIQFSLISCAREAEQTQMEILSRMLPPHVLLSIREGLSHDNQTFGDGPIFNNKIASNSIFSGPFFPHTSALTPFGIAAFSKNNNATTITNDIKHNGDNGSSRVSSSAQSNNFMQQNANFKPTHKTPSSGNFLKWWGHTKDSSNAAVQNQTPSGSLSNELSPENNDANVDFTTLAQKRIDKISPSNSFRPKQANGNYIKTVTDPLLLNPNYRVGNVAVNRRSVVSILFCDIYEFHELVSMLDMRQLVFILDRLFVWFENCVLACHPVLKIEHVGESFVAAVGLSVEDENDYDYDSTNYDNSTNEENDSDNRSSDRSTVPLHRNHFSNSSVYHNYNTHFRDHPTEENIFTQINDHYNNANIHVNHELNPTQYTHGENPNENMYHININNSLNTDNNVTIRISSPQDHINHQLQYSNHNIPTNAKKSLGIHSLIDEMALYTKRTEREYPLVQGASPKVNLNAPNCDIANHSSNATDSRFSGTFIGPLMPPSTALLRIANECLSLLECSLMMLEVSSKFHFSSDKRVRVKAGIHSGEVISGIVGVRKPQFALFGDTVNTASRMKLTGDVDKVHLSSSSKSLIDIATNNSDVFVWRKRILPIKGKGMLTTYLLEEVRQSPIVPQVLLQQQQSVPPIILSSLTPSGMLNPSIVPSDDGISAQNTEIPYSPLLIDQSFLPSSQSQSLAYPFHYNLLSPPDNISSSSALHRHIIDQNKLDVSSGHNQFPVSIKSLVPPSPSGSFGTSSSIFIPYSAAPLDINTTEQSLNIPKSCASNSVTSLHRKLMEGNKMLAVSSSTTNNTLPSESFFLRPPIRHLSLSALASNAPARTQVTDLNKNASRGFLYNTLKPPSHPNINLLRPVSTSNSLFISPVPLSSPVNSLANSPVNSPPDSSANSSFSSSKSGGDKVIPPPLLPPPKIDTNRNISLAVFNSTPSPLLEVPLSPLHPKSIQNSFERTSNERLNNLPQVSSLSRTPSHKPISLRFPSPHQEAHYLIDRFSSEDAMKHLSYTLKLSSIVLFIGSFIVPLVPMIPELDFDLIVNFIPLTRFSPGWDASIVPPPSIWTTFLPRAVLALLLFILSKTNSILLENQNIMTFSQYVHQVHTVQNMLRSSRRYRYYLNHSKKGNGANQIDSIFKNGEENSFVQNKKRFYFGDHNFMSQFQEDPDSNYQETEDIAIIPWWTKYKWSMRLYKNPVISFFRRLNRKIYFWSLTIRFKCICSARSFIRSIGTLSLSDASLRALEDIHNSSVSALRRSNDSVNRSLHAPSRKSSSKDENRRRIQAQHSHEESNFSRVVPNSGNTILSPREILLNKQGILNSDKESDLFQYKKTKSDKPIDINTDSKSSSNKQNDISLIDELSPVVLRSSSSKRSLHFNMMSHSPSLKPVSSIFNFGHFSPFQSSSAPPPPSIELESPSIRTAGVDRSTKTTETKRSRVRPWENLIVDPLTGKLVKSSVEMGTETDVQLSDEEVFSPVNSMHRLSNATLLKSKTEKKVFKNENKFGELTANEFTPRYLDYKNLALRKSASLRPVARNLLQSAELDTHNVGQVSSSNYLCSLGISTLAAVFFLCGCCLIATEHLWKWRDASNSGIVTRPVCRTQALDLCLLVSMLVLIPQPLSFVTTLFLLILSVVALIAAVVAPTGPSIVAAILFTFVVPVLTAYLLIVVSLNEKSNRNSWAIAVAGAEANRKGDCFLQDLVPTAVLQALKSDNLQLAYLYKRVVIIHADLNGFTTWAKGRNPCDVVDFLTELFANLDMATGTQSGVFKICTIGDAYVAISMLNLSSFYEPNMKNTDHRALSETQEATSNIDTSSVAQLERNDFDLKNRHNAVNINYGDTLTDIQEEDDEERGERTSNTSQSILRTASLTNSHHLNTNLLINPRTLKESQKSISAASSSVDDLTKSGKSSNTVVDKGKSRSDININLLDSSIMPNHIQLGSIQENKTTNNVILNENNCESSSRKSNKTPDLNINLLDSRKANPSPYINSAIGMESRSCFSGDESDRKRGGDYNDNNIVSSDSTKIFSDYFSPSSEDFYEQSRGYNRFRATSTNGFISSQDLTKISKILKEDNEEWQDKIDEENERESNYKRDNEAKSLSEDFSSGFAAQGKKTRLFIEEEEKSILADVLRHKKEVTTNVLSILNFASYMQQLTNRIRESRGIQGLNMRIGVHFGNCVGGLIGSGIIRFDIWGPDVIISNSVESGGVPGGICVSSRLRNVLTLLEMASSASPHCEYRPLIYPDKNNSINSSSISNRWVPHKWFGGPLSYMKKDSRRRFELEPYSIIPILSKQLLIYKLKDSDPPTNSINTTLIALNTTPLKSSGTPQSHSTSGDILKPPSSNILSEMNSDHLNYHHRNIEKEDIDENEGSEQIYYTEDDDLTDEVKKHLDQSRDAGSSDDLGSAFVQSARWNLESESDLDLVDENLSLESDEVEEELESEESPKKMK